MTSYHVTMTSQWPPLFLTLQIYPHSIIHNRLKRLWEWIKWPPYQVIMSLPVNDNGKEWKQCVCAYLLILWTSCSKRCPKPKTRIDAATTMEGFPWAVNISRKSLCMMSFFILKVLPWMWKVQLKWQEKDCGVVSLGKKKDFFGTSA